MKLSIAAKINLVFIFIFAVGFVVAGWVTNVLLKESAREETIQSARLLLGSASAVERTHQNKSCPCFALS